MEVTVGREPQERGEEATQVLEGEYSRQKE